jgi:hypothetical protein
MKLYTSGVKLPKLGSPQDRVLRNYLLKESQKEVAKTQLLAMMVANVVQFSDNGAARDWNDRVKKIWNGYLGLEYGLEIPEHTDQEVKMIEHYSKKVKHLKPKLTKGDKGQFIVTGLDALKE